MIKGIKICGVYDLETLRFIIAHLSSYVGFITNYEKVKDLLITKNLRNY